jgi:translation initiation factor 2 alpha subunit (eIF-2alpha)
MLQIRPTEIKAIADLLMQEHDDVDSLARLVIETLDTMRSKREQHVLVVIHPSLRVVQAVGPYGTANQALKDLNKKVVKYDDKSRAYVALLKDPTTIELG